MEENIQEYNQDLINKMRSKLDADLKDHGIGEEAEKREEIDEVVEHVEQTVPAEELTDVEEVIENLQKENQLLTEKIDGLEKTFESFYAVLTKLADSTNAMAGQLNQVNGNLHKENQKLKEGLYDSMMFPVLKDIIEIGNNILLDINRNKKSGDDIVVQALENVLEDVHIALDRHNVEVYQPNEGDNYEPLVQKVLRTIVTSDEQEDRKIAEVRGYGYRFIKGESNIVLSPCKVCVYKFENSTNIGGTENE